METDLVYVLDEEEIQNLYKLLANEAILGFLAFEDTIGSCVFINKLAREMFDLPERKGPEVLNLKDLFVTHSRGDFRNFSIDLLEHEGLYQDIVVRKMSGQNFIANIGVKNIELDDHNLTILMIQDITIQKKLQREITSKQIEIKATHEELLKQNKQLRELDLAKDRFIALTTHELRTPLSAMVSSAEVLKMGLYDTEEELSEFIDMIYEQGLHLSELVNDILDFAKIQAGKMDFFVSQGDPSEIIQELVESFESMAESSAVRIEFEEAPAALCYYDSLRLRQVLSNILTNAIKYNRKNGQVKIWLDTDKKFVRVFVRDTGQGISKDQQCKVFDEFETLGKVALHHKGTGLGMPISKRLMEGMGGQIHLESEPDVGSTFWVEIPVEKVLPEELYRERPDQSTDLAA